MLCALNHITMTIYLHRTGDEKEIELTFIIFLEKKEVKQWC